MTLTNLTDLPDDVLKTEFPMVYAAKIRQQQMQNNSSRTNVFLDQDNNQFYIQKDGSDRATRYDLLNINKAIQRPQFTDDAKLDADYMIRIGEHWMMKISLILPIIIGMRLEIIYKQ